MRRVVILYRVLVSDLPGARDNPALLHMQQFMETPTRYQPVFEGRGGFVHCGPRVARVPGTGLPNGGGWSPTKAGALKLAQDAERLRLEKAQAAVENAARRLALVDMLAERMRQP